MAVQERRRNARIEIRATDEERATIEQAVALAGTDLTQFVLGSALTEARRALADRTEFALSAEAVAAWEDLHAAPARHLPGLADLMARQSAFQE
ncbi:MAG: DUF1778 domain-containing protein [Actinomycetota bacterium]|nr:DUF1778 domain-containing protein [Actinomycetota bacterium]